ncbi:MAG TPA: BMC domain-containing protein [Tissierellales bacterium]|nr:BMC domain-containing protein [Tissierellales bacterium]
MNKALGLIESIGLATAVTALDAASKAADVTLIGYEQVIGVGGVVGITVEIAGEVAAVRAAVDAGLEAGNRVGTIVSSHVIPRPHDEIDKLIEESAKNLSKKEDNAKDEKAKKKNTKKKNTNTKKNKKEE